MVKIVIAPSKDHGWAIKGFVEGAIERRAINYVRLGSSRNSDGFVPAHKHAAAAAAAKASATFAALLLPSGDNNYCV